MSAQSKQVLVVDNNDEESQALASLLERAGHQPTTTWSGLEALELLASREFDLMLVSNYLPDLYVADFFARVNRLPEKPCVVVIEAKEAPKSTVMKVTRMIENGENLQHERLPMTQVSRAEDNRPEKVSLTK